MRHQTVKVKPGLFLLTRLIKYGVVGLGFFLITAGARCQTQPQEDESPIRPNVIILFSDQHNKKVMGFEGHPDVITPNLDKMASEGLVFDRA